MTILYIIRDYIIIYYDDEDHIEFTKGHVIGALIHIGIYFFKGASVVDVEFAVALVIIINRCRIHIVSYHYRIRYSMVVCISELVYFVSERGATPHCPYNVSN